MGLACSSATIILLTVRQDLPGLQQSQHNLKSLSMHLPLSLLRSHPLPTAL